MKKTTSNERLCERAAVSPQTILWEFQRLCSAGSLVETATSQSRRHVVGACYIVRGKIFGWI